VCDGFDLEELPLNFHGEQELEFRACDGFDLEELPLNFHGEQELEFRVHDGFDLEELPLNFHGEQELEFRVHDGFDLEELPLNFHGEKELEFRVHDGFDLEELTVLRSISGSTLQLRKHGEESALGENQQMGGSGGVSHQLLCSNLFLESKSTDRCSALMWVCDSWGEKKGSKREQFASRH